MKEALGEVMREFYELGIPEDVKARDVVRHRNARTVAGCRGLSLVLPRVHPVQRSHEGTSGSAVFLADGGSAPACDGAVFRGGGFPDVQGADYRVRVKMLQGYVDAVLYRDVIERHEVSSVQALGYTLDYVKHNFAHKISTRAISGVLKALGVSDSRECISDYLDDTGLARAVSPKSDCANGWLLENLVFLSLRRGDLRIEYYNTKKGDEVDFLVTDKVTKRRRLVQVAWELSRKDTEDRELSAIRDAETRSRFRIAWS